MKILLIALFLSIVLFFVLIRARSRKTEAPAAQSAGPRPSPQEVYLGLRNQIFHTTRKQVNLPAVSSPTEPWGVVMDFDAGKAVVTVVGISDGNASIYLSSGGGYLGGVGKPPINQAAKDFVRIAAEFQPKMQLVTEYPLPGAGEARFYVLTDAGVFSATASLADLNRHEGPLVKFYAAGQDIITQFRLDDEAHKAGSGS
jgi:hypothetical protein